VAGLGLSGIVAPSRAAADSRSARSYAAEVGILSNLLTFTLRGTILEEVDLVARRYRVRMAGQGAGVATRTEGEGIIREGRFKPTQSTSVHTIRGRDHRTQLAYDYERGVVEYHSVSYTFLLGRRRHADDLLRLPVGQHVDDLFSAERNFAAGKLTMDSDGAYRTLVVRRARPENEGPDDVAKDGYRAELAPVRFHATPDASGRLTALIDITGFSSWARATHPARIAFGADRHIETIESSLILGTTFTVRFAPAS
jgi:hypothetical protein